MLTMYDATRLDDAITILADLIKDLPITIAQLQIAWGNGDGDAWWENIKDLKATAAVLRVVTNTLQETSDKNYPTA